MGCERRNIDYLQKPEHATKRTKAAQSPAQSLGPRSRGFTAINKVSVEVPVSHRLRTMPERRKGSGAGQAHEPETGHIEEGLEGGPMGQEQCKFTSTSL